MCPSSASLWLSSRSRLGGPFPSSVWCQMVARAAGQAGEAPPAPPARPPGPFLTPGFLASPRHLLCLVFCFQVFLSYTDAGSSFVFGEAMVKGVFAFQVSSTPGPRGLSPRLPGAPS